MTDSFPHFRAAVAAGLAAAFFSTPAFAQTATPAPNVAQEEAITLKTFEVAVSREDSYESLNTSGVTGTNRSIRSLPMTMNAYTRTFIDEIGATDISDLMKFTPNVSYSLDSTSGGTQSPEQFRLRGLTS